MRYTPRQKKLKLKYKIAIPFFVLFFCVGYLVLNIHQKQQIEAKKFQICDFSKDKTVNTLHKNYKDTFEMQDHLFYGEHLGVYSTPYTGDANDDKITGKTLILKNLCDGEEYANVIGKGVDQKIKLGDLSIGYYEVYVVEDLKQKRVFSNIPFESSIKTITRNNNNKRIKVLSNQDILDDYNKSLDKGYVFIEVKNTTLATDEYDIAIDPSGNDTDFTYTASKGNSGNGLVEATETYKAAVLLKKELEAKGLKVLILRDKSEVVNTYGSEGKLAKAYKGNAKMYINLRFEEAEESPNFRGMDVYYSAHASKILADKMMFDLIKKVAVHPSTIHMGVGDSPGVIQSLLYESELDGRAVYDNDITIRESGGKATQAGMYSKNTKAGTAAFAKDNLYGMQSISINLGYVSNTSDANMWKKHSQDMMSSIATSLLSYLKVGDT
ncbi:MAG: N-acetylmuramoyl-L-alanine amidase [Breznakia sp.]